MADRDAIAGVKHHCIRPPDEAPHPHQLRPPPVDDQQRRVLQLAPMAVAPERQSQRIGTTLGRAALAAADRLGEPLVVVVGHPTYYPRFGFEPAERFGIEPPEPLPPGVFMVAPLAAYDLAVRGRIRYPPAFDSVT